MCIRLNEISILFLENLSQSVKLFIPTYEQFIPAFLSNSIHQIWTQKSYNILMTCNQWTEMHFCKYFCKFLWV